MAVVWAKQALLADGWYKNVRVAIDDDDGVITEVLANQPDDGTRTDILLPAPANLHSHGFQRAMAGLTEARGPDPADSFWTWRRWMYRFVRHLEPDDVQAIMAMVQMEMLQAGYATNVEFHYLHHQVNGAPYDNPAEMSARIVAAAMETGIGLTLLPVHYQFGGCDGRALTDGQLRFGTDVDQFQSLVECAADEILSGAADMVLGVAPHSLRAVSRTAMGLMADIRPGAPVHLHLAEQVAEVAEVQALWGARPVEWLLDNVAVDDRWCLIHCTQMQAAETQGLARTGAVAGLCPVTEANLGDGIFDGPGWLAAHGRLGIGSDSNVRISLTEELRLLEYSQRLQNRLRAVFATQEQSSGRRMYEQVLQGGAQAAGRNCGRIGVGQLADLVSLDSGNTHLQGRAGDTLLDSFIFAGDDGAVENVWSAGRHVVQNGAHVARESISRRYRQAMAKLMEKM